MFSYIKQNNGARKHKTSGKTSLIIVDANVSISEKGSNIAQLVPKVRDLYSHLEKLPFYINLPRECLSTTPLFMA